MLARSCLASFFPKEQAKDGPSGLEAEDPSLRQIPMSSVAIPRLRSPRKELYNPAPLHNIMVVSLMINIPVCAGTV